MIVRAVGMISEEVTPRRGAAREVQAATSEWLVVTSDHRLRSRLAAAIAHHGGVVRDDSAIDEWCRVTPVGRRSAFVDLVTTDDGSAAGILARLARPWVTPRPRLIVRGVDGDTTGERLARRAGAIAYLPGHVPARFLESLIAEVSP